MASRPIVPSQMDFNSVAFLRTCLFDPQMIRLCLFLSPVMCPSIALSSSTWDFRSSLAL